MSASFPRNTRSDSSHWQLPTPLAYSTLEMLREPLVNSADELIHLLEVWLRHMGWMWLVEYLHSDHQDDALDRVLFRTFLENQRELSVGRWAYMGSRISHLFRQKGWGVRLPLCRFSYGDPRDQESSLSRLLRYRNSFAHGSFDAQEKDILRHRALLWSLIAETQKALEDNPIVFWDPESRCVRAANGHWSKQPDITLPAQEPYLPYMLDNSGHRIQLAPMVRIRKVEPEEREHHIYAHIEEIPAWHLEYLSLHHSTSQQMQESFQHNPTVAAHLSRYQRQRQGYLDFRTDWEQARPPHQTERELQATLQHVVTALEVRRVERPSYVLLLGYPGSGKTYFVAQAESLFQGFDHFVTYRLEPQSPTTSATTFLRYMLRALCPGSEALSSASSLDVLREAWFQQLHLLKAKKKRLLLGVDQFHLAYQPYREDSLTIYDLLSDLHGISSEQVAVLLTARPGYREKLLHDTCIRIPSTETPLVKKYSAMLEELGLNPIDFPDPATPGWSEEERMFQRMLLFVLSAAPRALSAFEVRETLEQLLGQKPNLFPPSFLFSPRIERTLWELRPLLVWKQNNPDPHKVYAPYSASFGSWLLEHLKP